MSSVKVRQKQEHTQREAGAGGGGDDALARVQAIQRALASSADLNPISDLIELARTLTTTKTTAGAAAGASVKALDRALLVLGQALASLVHHGSSKASTTAKTERKMLLYPDQVDADGNLTSTALPPPLASQLSPAEAQVSEWLKEQWKQAVHLLCALTGHSDEGVRSTALRQLFALQLAASNALSSRSASALASSSQKDDAGVPEKVQWAPSPWRATVLALTAGPPIPLEPTSARVLRRKSSVHPDLHGLLLDEFVEKYDDVRLAFLRELRAILERPPPSAIHSHESLRSNTLQPLIFLTAIPTKEEDINAFFLPALTKRRAKDGKKKVKTQKAKGAIGGDGSGDEEAGREAPDDMQDWFSDSDDEPGQNQNDGPSNASTTSKTTGLGKAARDQRAKRKRKGVLPFADAVLSLSAQRSAFSSAWLALMLPRAVSIGSDGNVKATFGPTKPLGGTLSVAQTHQILLVLHSQILPHFSRPNLVHEFLVDCLTSGFTDADQVVLGAHAGSIESLTDAAGSNAATALLALHGLYVLILQHNLDYPDFFKRLYTLLLYTPHLLHMRYRSRFLSLLETFLGSSLLPAALVASFAKRLSRVALRASPAAAVSVIPLVWNLLKRHKTCLSLIHRDFDGDRLAQGPAGIADPFDALEADPLKTRALESSLWELAALGAQQAAMQRQGITSTNGGEVHYLHSTATLARILAEPFLKERYNLDDFLDITYGTLFENESARVLASGGDASGKRKVKPISTPVVRASLGDVELDRYDRERAAHQLPQRQEGNGSVSKEDDTNGGQEAAVATAASNGAVSAPLGFRAFTTAKVRAKRRKLAGSAPALGVQAATDDGEDVMDLWLF